MILVEALHGVIDYPDELQLQAQSNFLDIISWIPCSDFILWKGTGAHSTSHTGYIMDNIIHICTAVVDKSEE